MEISAPELLWFLNRAMCLFPFFLSPLPVFPFMCYTCQDQESNKDCLTISMCAKEDKHCVTIRKDVGTSRFGNSTLFVLEGSSPRNGIYSQYRNSNLDDQLLGDTDLVAPYCSIQTQLIFLLGTGEMMRTHRAAPGSAFTPGDVHLSLPEMFSECFGQTSPWLTPCAKHRSVLGAPQRPLHMLLSQISGHAEHSA